MISEIVPHAVYDSESDLYELHLKVKMEDNFPCVWGQCLYHELKSNLFGNRISELELLFQGNHF